MKRSHRWPSISVGSFCGIPAAGEMGAAGLTVDKCFALWRSWKHFCAYFSTLPCSTLPCSLLPRSLSLSLSLSLFPSLHTFILVGPLLLFWLFFGVSLSLLFLSSFSPLSLFYFNGFPFEEGGADEHGAHVQSPWITAITATAITAATGQINSIASSTRVSGVITTPPLRSSSALAVWFDVRFERYWTPFQGPNSFILTFFFRESAQCMAELATVAKLVSISERREEGGGGETPYTIGKY